MGKVKYIGDDDPSLITTQLFGSARNDDKQRPSRVIVRDGNLLNPQALKNTELPYTEAKTEVVIDRITSAAVPRQLERVPAGAKFELDIVLNVFKGDLEGELLNNLFHSLVLVQDDYLGGSGSRGSGQVGIEIAEVVERPAEFYHGQGEEADITTSSNVPDELRAA